MLCVIGLAWVPSWGPVESRWGPSAHGGKLGAPWRHRLLSAAFAPKPREYFPLTVFQTMVLGRWQAAGRRAWWAAGRATPAPAANAGALVPLKVVDKLPLSTCLGGTTYRRGTHPRRCETLPYASRGRLQGAVTEARRTSWLEGRVVPVGSSSASSQTIQSSEDAAIRRHFIPDGLIPPLPFDVA